MKFYLPRFRLIAFFAISILFILPIFSGIFFLTRDVLVFLSLDQILALFEESYLIHGFFKTFYVSFASVAISWLLTYFFGGLYYRSKLHKWAERMLPPLLAVPHIALAIGFFFLVSFFADISAIDTFFEFSEIYELPLILFFVLKELPFLLAVLNSSLSDHRVRDLYRASTSLGYDRHETWKYLIFPFLSKKIFMASFLVLIFVAGSPEISGILSNDLPPLLAVRITYWLSDANLGYQPRITLGVILLFAAIFFSIAAMYLFYLVMKKRVFAKIRKHGVAPQRSRIFRNIFGGILAGVLLSFFYAAMLFPLFFDHRPPLLSLSIFNGNIFSSGEAWVEVLWNSVIIGICSSIPGLIFGILYSEFLSRVGPSIQKIFAFILFLPLIIPSILLSYGFYLTGLHTSDFIFWNVVFAHIFFLLPYVTGILHGDFSQFREEYLYASLSLGKSFSTSYLRIKLSMLKRSILTALGFGFVISFTQYVPTLFLGQGRINTLPTETYAVFQGANESLMAHYALIQTLIPLLIFIGLTFAKDRYVES